MPDDDDDDDELAPTVGSAPRRWTDRSLPPADRAIALFDEVLLSAVPVEGREPGVVAILLPADGLVDALQEIRAGLISAHASPYVGSELSSAELIALGTPAYRFANTPRGSSRTDAVALVRRGLLAQVEWISEATGAPVQGFMRTAEGEAVRAREVFARSRLDMRLHPKGRDES